MKKISTAFVRDMSRQPALVTDEWLEGCEWVRDGEGVATVKHDGSCCMVRDGFLYKRREVKKGKPNPPDFELSEKDERTGKSFGWVPVGGGPEDKYHREALGAADYVDGTYELMGPKVQRNTEGFDEHVLVEHGRVVLKDVPRTVAELREWLENRPDDEGVVWHHEYGRMAKIKRRDFGLPWPPRKEGAP